MGQDAVYVALTLTLEPGASVALVARAHRVNANQVFKWRREFERGELEDGCAALIPVMISGASESAGDGKQVLQSACGGAIHIEFAGHAALNSGTEYHRLYPKTGTCRPNGQGRSTNKSLEDTASAFASLTMFSSATFLSPRSTPPT